jgi:hypothetical protein
MIKGNIYKYYFSNIAKLILTLIVVSWGVFLFFIIKEGISYITKISLATALILMFSGSFFANNLKLIGEIYFGEDRLIINNNGERTVFLFNKINNIYIYYEGYKYQDDSSLYRPIYFKDGTGNVIRFSYLDSEKSYEFQIEDEKFLTRLIKQWNSSGKPKIRIYNKNKKIIWTNYK